MHGPGILRELDRLPCSRALAKKFTAPRRFPGIKFSFMSLFMAPTANARSGHRGKSVPCSNLTILSHAAAVCE